MSSPTTRDADQSARADRLLTLPFAAMCAVSFFSFAQIHVTQTVLPLMVLSIGGDAILVGVVVAAFSMSSFLTRPLLGLLIDRWSLKGSLALGTLVLSAAGFAYVIPSLLIVLVTRVAHGIGWAAVNTAGNTAIAALAPPARRAEAAGYYAIMPGFAQATLPALALTVLPLGGFGAAFAIAGVCGAIATLFVRPIDIPLVAGARRSSGEFWGGLLDRSAFAPMIMETLSSTAFTLFVVFMPLYVREIAVGLDGLALYYAATGMTIVVGRAAFGRLSDRIGRGPGIALGSVFAIVGVSLLWMAQDLPVLVVGGVACSLGSAVVSPAIFALVADRANPMRRGAAFATYSMAFQIAHGLGGLLWGFLIASSGFPAAFAAAIAIQVGLIGMALRLRSAHASQST